ncbi:alpha/beta hydrolase-fold protein [Brevibacterium renqingii]|uniref:alpha/beta hydrolase-fold protein n=1 Tax=Brevibacterium renqingii TaxID=2776916 RepID=UPI001ADF801A|nr:alpha/beta hydrolase-fold protein [Brevibacterium renqingii]
MIETEQLGTWCLGSERDDWKLRILLRGEHIPADCRPGPEQSLFADLNGITGRADVARGIMIRQEGSDGVAYAIDLAVPRGFRGSLHFMPVPTGLSTADRPTWLDALDGAFVPTRHPGLRVLRSMRGISVLEIAAPDADPLGWSVPDPARSHRPRIGSRDVEERVVTLDSTPRRIWSCRPQRAAATAPMLVVFDGRGFVDGGLLAAVDELDSPPSAVIAIDHEPADADAAGSVLGGSTLPSVPRGSALPTSDPPARGLRASDLVMNPRFCDDVLDLVASMTNDPDHAARTLVAGASYGGLAAAYFALRHPQRFRGICLSPSFWQTDVAGRRIWHHVPESGTFPRPAFVIDYGVLEPAIADAVAEAVPEFADRGLDIEVRSFVGGHEHLWWRELLLVRLGEALAEDPAPH